MRSKFLLRKNLLIIGDLVLIIAAALGSFALRTDLGPLFRFYLPQAIWFTVISLIIKPIVYYYFGLYRRMWVYASVQELKLIVIAVSTGSLAVALTVIILRAANILPNFPRSVIPIDWLLCLVLIGGLRFSMRVLAEIQPTTNHESQRPKRVLVVGAGDAGALVVREMQKNPSLPLVPVCFLDDDPVKQHQQIHGVPVVGRLSDLPRTLVTKRIDEVVIAIPSAAGSVIRHVAEVCQSRNMAFRTMPGIYELLGGKVSVSRLREVDITDLLRRETAQFDDRAVGFSLSGKRVMITGAGGSIGSELCRQVARWSPSELLLLGHGENSIFETLLDLEENFPSVPLHPIIADVRDIDRLTNIFEKYHPEVIFHTAAHKHVPLMEANIEEAITNNVLGTRNIVDLATSYGVERLVLISTDKAIRPSNVYGAAKRLAELMVMDAGLRYKARFSVVRFGNVLGSRGSIIPLFKRQIAAGGPITITHPDMHRYFMTIPEAVHLVLQASALGQGGEAFVLKMGDQVRIIDLAEDLIRLSGLEPGKDIDIVFTGIRPGEKLSEDLWDSQTHYRPTEHPDIVLSDEERPLSGEALYDIVEELIHLSREGDTDAIMRILDESLPGAAIRSTPPPDLTSVL